MDTDWQQVLTDEERSFAQSQGARAKQYATVGVFKELAAMTATGESHLDVRTSSSDYFANLLKKAPNLRMVGIHENPQLLEAAAQDLQMKGHVAVMVGIGALKTVREVPFELDTVYDYHDIPKAPIHMVLGDVRRQEALKSLLKGDQFDSGSFLFPDVGRSSLLQSPFFMGCGSLDFFMRFQEVLEQIRLSALHLLSHKIKPGGKLLYADRLRVRKSGLKTEDDLKNLIREHIDALVNESPLAKYTDQWDLQTVSVRHEPAMAAFTLVRNHKPV